MASACRLQRLEGVRTVVAKFLVAGTAMAAVLAPAARAVHATAPHTVVGTLEVLSGIASVALPAPRHAFVLLPPGYDTKQRYPVLYATDGQDLFDAATAAGGEELALDELLAARPAGIPALIVVGIEGSPQALREYSPPGTMDGARGDDYLRLLVDVVKPLVDHKYATQPGRQSTYLFGQGAGGLLAVYAAWTRPDVFGGSIAIDWPDVDPAVLPPAAQRPAQSVPPRLWIAVAGGDMAQRPSSAQLLETLRRGAVLTYVVVSPHAPRITAVAAGLRALFTQ
jgi:hypothetical protein